MVKTDLDNLQLLFAETRVLQGNFSLLEKQIEELNGFLNLSIPSFEEKDNLIDKLNSQIKINEIQRQKMLWQLYRQDNESEKEAIKRMLQSISVMENTPLYLAQECTRILLWNFDKICRTENISYWIDFRTLYGAVQFGNIAPYNDSTHVGIMRKDLTKFCDIIKGNDIFKMSQRYTMSKNGYLCIYRFIFHADVPCYLDIFVYDYADDTLNESWKKYVELRKEYTEESIELEQKLKADKTLNPDIHICNLLMRYLEKCEDSLHAMNTQKAVIWGFENFLFGAPRIFETETIFPTVEMQCLGGLFMAPHYIERYLKKKMDEWLVLPEKIYDGQYQYQKMPLDKIDLMAELAQKHKDNYT